VKKLIPPAQKCQSLLN